MKEGLRFVPSHVEGLPEVKEAAVFPDRLELCSAGKWVSLRFQDMVEWSRPAWLWRVLARLGWRRRLLPVGSIIIVTMAAVGGCWWPIDLEPRWMRNVALAFPTTWAMDAYNDLMIRRRTIEIAWRPTAVMLAYGVLYLIIGVALFRRRMRRPTA